MARGTSETGPDTTRVEPALRALADKLSRCRALRKSWIVIRASGRGGGEYCVDCAPGSARLTDTRPTVPPTIEITGEARQVQALLGGQRDPRKLFLAGGLGVRGDLRYLSDLAVELGLLKEPL